MPVSSRKAFLGAAASTALMAAAPPSPAPTGSASPTPKPSKVSAAAVALAQTMRKFDAQLTDADVEKIAQGIDGNLKLGASMNPKGRMLRNWNEPATAFEAAE